MTESFDNPWFKQIPNQLTIARVASIPLLLVLYPLNITYLNFVCGFIFMAAAITDFLDGYLARRYDSVTRFGALVDPVADKMLGAAGLLLVAHAQNGPAWMIGLILCRDFGISGLRLLALEKNADIEVSNFGKWKTTFQLTATTCLLINDPLFGWPWREVGMICLWLTLGFSLFSAYLYVKAFWAASETLFKAK